MVDVIIPVYRPDEKLNLLINSLKDQTVKPEHVYFMMTLGDTKENERVRSILEQMPQGVIVPVEKKNFDHGGTRNLGASMSEAEYMLFMTQDAVPETNQLVELLKEQLDLNEMVATAYGRQLPSDEVGVIEHYTRQFNYGESNQIKSLKDLDELGIKTYFCSNVCAMYKKSVYEKMGGFVTHTIFNEDMIMAGKVVQAGYSIAYVADAKVVHAHKYTYRQQFHRNFDMAVSQADHPEVFEGVKSESEGIKLVKKTMSYLFHKGKWYLVFDLVFQSGFKFLGYRMGRRHKKLPMWLVKRCSMNKSYWRNENE